MARDVTDLALLLDAMTGRDERLPPLMPPWRNAGTEKAVLPNRC